MPSAIFIHRARRVARLEQQHELANDDAGSSTHDQRERRRGTATATATAAFFGRLRLYRATLQLRAQSDDERLDVRVAHLLGYVLERQATADLPCRPPPNLQAHVLLFDGGSSGNPGAGGYGAAIVRIAPGAAPTIVWAQAGYLAHPATTNNVAELAGVAAGLRQLRQLRPACVVVIGDSQIVLKALRSHRPFKQPRLRATYVHARATADWLPIQGWYHHLRHHNKMADALANAAMDMRATVTWTDTTLRKATVPPFFATFLHNDLTPWMVAYATAMWATATGSPTRSLPDFVIWSLVLS